MRLCVHQVLAVDLEEETFTMEFDLFFRWQDPRLRRADRATKACSGRFARFDHTVKCNRMCLTGIGLPEFGFRLTAKSEGREAAKDFLLWRAYSERARARISSKWKVLKNLWLQVAYVASKPLSFASNSPVAKEQALGSFLCKEEPDFEAFGQLFGTSNKLNLAKLMEEPIVLTEHQRLTDGENGETVLFRKMKATFKETHARAFISMFCICSEVCNVLESPAICRRTWSCGDFRLIARSCSSQSQPPCQCRSCAWRLDLFLKRQGLSREHRFVQNPVVIKAVVRCGERHVQSAKSDTLVHCTSCCRLTKPCLQSVG